MQKDDALAPIEFTKERLESRIARVLPGVIGQEDDAIGMQRVHGIVQFTERIIHIWKWQRGEKAKMLGMVTHDTSGELVGYARQVTGQVAISKDDAWSREREDGRGHALPVYHGQALLRTPGHKREILAASSGHADPGKSCHVFRWHEMMVHVDARCLLRAQLFFPFSQPSGWRYLTEHLVPRELQERYKNHCSTFTV